MGKLLFFSRILCKHIHKLQFLVKQSRGTLSFEFQNSLDLTVYYCSNVKMTICPRAFDPRRITTITSPYKFNINSKVKRFDKTEINT